MLPLKEGTGVVWPRTGLPTKHHDARALPYRGGSGDMTGMRHACQRPPPSAGPGFEFPHLTLGTRFVKSRRGVEKPKRTEQMKIVARRRGSRSALQGQIVSIFAAVTPQGRLQNARGGVSPAVFPIT